MMLIASVRRKTSLVAYNLGLLAGGVIVGAGLAVATSLLRPPLPAAWGLAFVSLACVVALAHELDLVTVPLPQNRRQVPITVFRLGPFFGPLQFGIEMGTGMRTYVSSAVPYMLLCPILLFAGPWHAVTLGAGFGFGRAVMATASVLSGDAGRWSRAWTARQRALGTGFAVLVVTILGWTLLNA